jgi:hypothetical protein
MSTTTRLGAAVLIACAMTGCTSSRQPAARPTAVTNTSPPSSAGSAAAMELQPFVPAADDVPAGMELQTDESGPAGVGEISSFSTDPEGKEHLLEEHHLEAGYAVQYLDASSGAVLSAYVVRFASVEDAQAIYADDVAESEREAERFTVTKLGDEAAAFRHRVSEGDIAELVTVRVRLGDLVWAVRTGSPDRADAELARQVAQTIVGRAA